jgi:hypothetical protein
VGFETLTVVGMKGAFCHDMKPYRYVDGYQSFRVTWRIHLQGEETETAPAPQKLVYVQPITRRLIPKYTNQLNLILCVFSSEKLS